MVITWSAILLLTLLGSTVSLPTKGQKRFPLLDKVQTVAERLTLSNSPSDLNVGVHQINVDTPLKNNALFEARLKAWDAQWDVVPTSPGLTNVCETFCPKFCRKVTANGLRGKGQGSRVRECHFACTNLCDKKLSNSNPFIGNPDYDVVYTDFNFDHHDLNKDKFITKREFAFSEMVPQGDVDHVFSFVDANGDGYISKQEYEGGPLLFTVQMAAELGAMSKPIPVQDQTKQAA